MYYTDTIENVAEHMLHGFFTEFPNPPSPTTHLKLLHNSSYIILAIDASTQQVVGFITAISDNVLSAYIPLLEVLPDYQGKGIGTELLKQLLSQLSHLYMIDLLCDAPLQAYYQRFGLQPAPAMMIRHYANQSGN
ncbi:GNAT family N-acetyltransferase [Alkalicoccobacillus porphyridii]|uniref:GNAT family N-acetyltransferase n=1 Tax=Alkalicoccobacillus porphyridii TaxID=2597270 RepID=A0A553ZYJ5_9BACI|nr:GNAT family N-acetyltransferase [Alkalicoccobacillus porphyridii]